jgi:hypothetical protein
MKRLSATAQTAFAILALAAEIDFHFAPTLLAGGTSRGVGSGNGTKTCPLEAHGKISI